MSTVHTPRPYQAKTKQEIYDAWRKCAVALAAAATMATAPVAGALPVLQIPTQQPNVLAVMPTGAGKTFTFADIIQELNRATCAVAHRQELVQQISLALAREGVRHRIIGDAKVARRCSAIHLQKLGADYINPRSHVAVASVDTLVKMDPAKDPWFASVGLVVMDEAHHVLKDNKWGRAFAMFPNALGLGVTATPIRADGCGLGRHADGLFDQMVVGPTMRELINAGYLTDYRVVAPRQSIDLTDVTITDTGDFSKPKLTAARRKSTLTGDVIDTWQQFIPGKRTVVFDTDADSAAEMAQAFRDRGVPAASVTYKTDDLMRDRIMGQFERGELTVLVNVDMFGEGFDLPAIEAVVMARPTASYSLYVQQFGRALRLLDGKEWAWIIDHVGNVERHRLPDAARVWSLDRREKRASKPAEDALPVRNCLNPLCASTYERDLGACPYCKVAHVPQARGSIEQVDGDLIELDPEILKRMRGEVARIDGAPLIPRGLDQIAQKNVENQHYARQRAQVALRDTIMLWGGWQKHLGRDDRQAQRRFYLQFGIDTLGAQALNRQDAEILRGRVQAALDSHNVTRKAA